jgi:hypothetical protein
MKKLFTTLFILILSTVLIAQTTEWYYNYDLGTSTEEGKDIVFGNDGNIYVVGTTDGSQINYNIIVISLTQDGTERWTYTYDSPVTNSTDGANKIYYGNDNRIYIAGYNSDSQDADKFFVLCLDNNGNYVWEYQFLDVLGAYGQAFDVVLGTDGNVYACGKVDYDFFVVSINSMGQQNWTYRLNGDCGYMFCDDAANQLVYGEDDKIYVTGYLYNAAPTGKDLLVVSLTTGGQENWKYFYNSADNGGDAGQDIIYGRDGNLYIMGGEGNQGHNESDILVLSIQTSGSERWTFMYDGPGEKPYWSEVPYEMIQGFDGNLYIAARDGGINTDLDVCVFSVTEEGEFKWVNRYAGVYGDYDMPFSLTQTPDGNVHAAGYFCGLIAEVGMLSTHGETGRRLWAYRYIGDSESMDAAYGITSDPNGYVYLTGYDNVDNNNNKLFVIKLNPPRNSDGWYHYQRIIKIGYDKYHSESEGYSIEKTSNGNFIVTGDMGTTSSPEDVFLMKIDEACDTFWTKRIGGSDAERGYSVIETTDGGFAVTGYTYSYGAGGRDVYLIKTDSLGQLEWEKYYGGALDDEGNGIVQAADGGYIIAGRTSSYGLGQGDIWLIRTDADGDTLWTRLLGGEKPDVANKLIKTSDGNFVFTGRYGIPDGAGNLPIWYLVKFNVDGDTLWTKKYYFNNFTGKGNDLVEVENGNLMVAGYMYLYPVMKPTLMKVNSMGDTLWTKGYSVNALDGLMAIDKTDDNGFVILPGEINGMYGAIEVLKIDEGGNVVYVDTIGYNHTNTATCYTKGNDILSIGANDYLTLGDGKIQNNSFWNLLITRKGGHLTVLTDVEEDEEITFSQPTDYQLFQNYPNPFNPITIIRYSIPQTGNVKLVIYDILGRKVKTLIDEFKSTGTYEISFDAGSLASGVYFYQLKAGEFIQTNKMILLR